MIWHIEIHHIFQWHKPMDLEAQCRGPKLRPECLSATPGTSEPMSCGTECPPGSVEFLLGYNNYIYIYIVYIYIYIYVYIYIYISVFVFIYNI